MKYVMLGAIFCIILLVYGNTEGPVKYVALTFLGGIAGIVTSKLSRMDSE